MPRRLLENFHPRQVPWITRASYRQELVNAMTFPVAVAMVEGGVIGVLAKKAFAVNDAVFATLMAAPMFANLTSFLWARLARGRRKVPFINGLQVMVLICVAAFALLPTAGAGPVLLTGLIVLVRCLLAGIVTLRSTVWRLNYPRNARARITAKFTIINSLIMAVGPLLGARLLDASAQSFRIIYPLCALIAMGGVISFSRIRLRGERELLRFERGPDATPQPHGTPAPIYEYDPTAQRHNLFSVLRQDHQFRQYMLWQFVAGSANMMSEVVLVYIVAELTAGMANEYQVSIALTTTIPMLLAMATLPTWARYLDRVHINQFRARQGWMWIVDQMGNWIGAATGMLPVIGGARVMQGIVRGGGMLAWNLGHNDFADRRMVALYMGIHVTLTGVRGAIAPYLAITLYRGWNDGALSWLGLHVPGFGGMGYHVFLVTATMAAMSEIGFRAMCRSGHVAADA